MSAIDRAALDGWTHRTVDLVAIQRVRNGQPAELSAADWQYLATRLDGSNEEARLIGQALGVSVAYVQKTYSRNKEGQR
ncbi:MAG TPA: hypothetical protein VK547_09610 [Candidatus Udaeobacter sp.]|nr:hypothetical protein [Candidatus Udaeobacter sp.]